MQSTLNKLLDLLIAKTSSVSEMSTGQGNPVLCLALPCPEQEQGKKKKFALP